MKELIAYTLEQRLALYHHVRSRLLNDIKRCEEYGSGFCWMIEMAVRHYFDEDCDSYPMFDQEDSEEVSCFPELIKHKPEVLVMSTGEHSTLLTNYFWFDVRTESGGAKRLEIIEKVIEEVKTKINMIK